MTVVAFNQNDRFEFPASKLTFKVVERELVGKGLNGIELPVPSHKALYASRNGSPVHLGTVGRTYTPMPNADLYETVEDVFRRTMTPRQLTSVHVTERASHAGGFCAREYRFKDLRPTEADPAYRTTIEAKNSNSDLGFRVVVFNGYDGKTGFGVHTGLIDYWCTNGCASLVAEYDGNLKKRHSARATPALLVPVIESGIGRIQDDIRQLQHWANLNVTDDQVKALFEGQFSDRRAAKLFEQFERECADRGNTVWAAYSALTYFSTHNSDEFAVRGNNDNVAATLHRREREVTRIVRGGAWADFVNQAA